MGGTAALCCWVRFRPKSAHCTGVAQGVAQALKGTRGAGWGEITVQTVHYYYYYYYYYYYCIYIQ
jgi:hypothetical protein